MCSSRPGSWRTVHPKPPPLPMVTAGDSGGPLFYLPAPETFMQIGLVSFGKTGCIGSPSEPCRSATLSLTCCPPVRQAPSGTHLVPGPAAAQPARRMQTDHRQCTSNDARLVPAPAPQTCSPTSPSCAPGSMRQCGSCLARRARRRPARSCGPRRPAKVGRARCWRGRHLPACLPARCCHAGSPALAAHHLRIRQVACSGGPLRHDQSLPWYQ